MNQPSAIEHPKGGGGVSSSLASHFMAGGQEKRAFIARDAGQPALSKALRLNQ